jgi:serine/threonine protein kinase
MNIEYYKKHEPLFNVWYIKELLGEGSFGKVYAIERQDYGIYRAALKAITIPQSQSELDSVMLEYIDEASVKSHFKQVVDDIIAEIVLLSRLKGNSNIVSYEDHVVIEHENGIGWDILIRMELLTPLLKSIKTTQMTHGDVIKLGIDMCTALQLCRQYNIIHRDIKPENILISDTGNFKLGDFGIARVTDKTSLGLSKKGTYTYMAPEIYKGEQYGSSADIYSLGIVMYRLMNRNRAPFLPPYPTQITHNDRENAIMKRMGGSNIPPPVDANERLASVILKACAYKPENRYLSPEQMREELEAAKDADSYNTVLSNAIWAIDLSSDSSGNNGINEQTKALWATNPSSNSYDITEQKAIMKNIFCTNCGINMAGDNSFCTGCGTPAVSKESHPAIPQSMDYSSNAHRQQPNQQPPHDQQNNLQQQHYQQQPMSLPNQPIYQPPLAANLQPETKSVANETKKKKKTSGAAIISIVAVCLVLIGVGIFIYFDPHNYFGRNEPPPGGGQLSEEGQSSEPEVSPQVTASPEVQSIDMKYRGITVQELTMIIGDELSVSALLEPYISNIVIEWTSSDTAVFNVLPATTGSEASIVAVNPGSAMLVITSGNITIARAITVLEDGTLFCSTAQLADHTWGAWGEWDYGDETHHIRTRICLVVGCTQTQTQAELHDIWSGHHIDVPIDLIQGGYIHHDTHFICICGRNMGNAGYGTPTCVFSAETGRCVASLTPHHDNWIWLESGGCDREWPGGGLINAWR